MQDALIASVVCLGPLVLVGAFIGLIVWLVRRSAQDARIATLEREVRALQYAVAQLGQSLAARAGLAAREALPPGPPVPVPVPEAVPVPVPEAVPEAVPVRAATPEAVPVPVQEAEAVPETAAVQEAAVAAVQEAAVAAVQEAAVAPAPALPAAPAPPPPTGEGGWERWIGVRGAAALGSGVLVLAGLFFFRYSIEHGLISPAVRVALGTAVGLGCLVASESVLRRRYAHLAHWIAGAGIAILYLSFWAAGPLYALLSTAVAGALMILVTAACCVLAIRRRSVPVAALGLLGGFATPLLLSTGQDRPVALFSYLLVLDVALLFVAHRRRWPWLALLALLGTTMYQGLWIVGRMGPAPAQVLLGMGIVVVFAAAFAVATSIRPRDAAGGAAAVPSALDRTTRLAGVLLPFFFALHFGLRADLGPHFWPIAALLTVLVAGAALVARSDGAPWIGLSAICAALGVLASWLLVHGVTGSIGWEVVGFAVVVALVAHVAVELDRARRWETAAASIVWTAGVLFLTTIAVGTTQRVDALPWLLGWGALAALGLRAAALPHRAPLHLPLALLGSVALLTLHVAHAGEPGLPAPAAMLALVVATAVAWALGSLLARRSPGRTWASHGAALFATLLLLHLAVLAPALAVPTVHLVGATVILSLVATVAAARSQPGPWLVGTGLSAAIVLAVIGATLPASAGPDRTVLLVGHGAVALLLALLPFLLPARLREVRWTWRGAALVLLFLVPGAAHAYETAFGSTGIASVPLALAAIGVVAAAGVARLGPSDRPARRSAMAWVAGVAIALVTVAVPLELENEWLTIAWALQTAALLLLWRRVDHPGLKWIALALAAAVTVRLVANPWVLDYSAPGPLPILNWIAYTYLVPAAALLLGRALLRGREVARLRPSERSLIGDQPRGAQALAVAVIAVLFVWMNLAIVDLYSTGPSLTIPIERLPARDLTMSVSWAVFGLCLLALGMWRKSTALRVLSLLLVLVTSGKVFLYDLAMLKDLYRVASLAGLAVSLMLISLAYQRFVFRRPILEEAR